VKPLLQAFRIVICAIVGVMLAGLIVGVAVGIHPAGFSSGFALGVTALCVAGVIWLDWQFFRKAS
jgi:hypothetical protein